MHFSLCLTSSELKLYRKTHFFHDGIKTVFLKFCDDRVLNFRATGKPSYGHTVSAQNHLTVQNYHAIIILFSCLYICILCGSHLEVAFETVFEEMKLDVDFVEDTFALVLF